MRHTSSTYIKYSTPSGNNYVYDASSDQIVRLCKDAYELLEYYLTLSEEDFYTHSRDQGFSEKSVHTLVDAYKKLLALGMLAAPTIPSDNLYPYKIYFENGIYDFDDFFKKYSRLLILEVTQQCNLRCDYCCYGTDYSNFRKHSRKTMDYAIAKNAISDFLSRKSDEGHAISFYGGEPLLEFNLIKKLINFSNEYVVSKGKRKPSFHVTTNGTLLEDDIIHYFVENNVAVLISLDGDKETHDRYRKYNIQQEQNGSFDDVMKRMMRFVELYPDYPRRGISMVVSPPLNISKNNAFLKELLPAFPTTRVSSIRKSDSCFSCEKASLPISIELDKVSLSTTIESHDTDTDKKEKSAPAKYMSWSKDDMLQLSCGLENYTKCVTMHGVTIARREYPLLDLLMSNAFVPIHFRSISDSENLRFPIRCLPGFTRLFCDVFGNYYPCERIGTDPDICLGNVHQGINHESIQRIIKQFQVAANCDNCAVGKVCSVCYSFLVKTGCNGKEWNHQTLHSTCDSFIGNTREHLILYTTILESSPNAFDALVDKEMISLMDRSKFHLYFREIELVPPAEVDGIKEPQVMD